ncbi:MAG TPA: N-acetylmuramoyl-L-alanine amidase [Oleiagrimonas sp.]|nr:N-acetylmuramoyl-L-alanine amidase [Oleiagrimonas sp.]
MRGIRHIFSGIVFTALAVGVGLCPAQAAELNGVRVSTNATRTRAVIDLSGPVKYKLFQLSNPGRVVLDFSDSALDHGFKAPDNEGLLKDVRTGRHGKHGVRVVLDLAGKAHPKSFLLEPKGDHGYRLVVDLYGDGSGSGHDVAETLNERQAATRAAKLLQGARKVIVAVDAGHGGVDPGAHGPDGTQEADVTLDVAKKLARMIDKQPGMEAILTRKGDYYVGLKERRVIARKHNADLFISIHADAFTSPSANGSSVWVLSTHGKVSEAARWLANSQNHSGLLGGVSLDDKSDALASVLLDLQQGYAIHASKRVANNVFDQLAKLGPTHRDHIERANFVVLRSPDIPSILVETAFITNPEGERKLQSSAYQTKLAGAVLRGVETYFTKTPPPGTWFAMKARQRRGELVTTGTTGSGQGDVYKVASGDTLSGIARRYGVSVSDIKSANHMSGNMVQVGAMLTIPGS